MGSATRVDGSRKSTSRAAKTSAALARLALARQSHYHKILPALPRTRANTTENALRDVQEELVKTHRQLSAREREVLQLQSNHREAGLARVEADSLRLLVEKVSEQSEARLKVLKNTRRKLTRANNEAQELKKETLAAVQRANQAKSDFAHLWQTTADEIVHLKLTVARKSAEISELKLLLKSSRKKIRALQRRCTRAPDVRARAVARALHAAARKSATFDLCQNGAVRNEVRQMARALVKAGCGQEHVSAVIKEVSAGIGITVTGSISRRTVGRSILEGGIAAELQLAHEIKQTDSKFNITAMYMY